MKHTPSLRTTTVRTTTVSCAALLTAGAVALAIPLTTSQAATPPASPSPVSAAVSSSHSSHSSSSVSSVASSSKAVHLPADFPLAEVPLPAGKLTAASGVSPRWGVIKLVTGSDTVVMKRVMNFYKTRGWTRTSVNGLSKGVYTLGIASSNHDHTATASDLTIVVVKG